MLSTWQEHLLLSDYAMAVSDSELPTYEALRALRHPITASVDFLRLRWYFNGPLVASLHVLEDATDPNSAQSPYMTADGREHVISLSSLTEPPVSSINVTVRDLDDWAWKWDDAHRPEESEDAVYVDGKLVRCCNEDRPYLNSTVPSCSVKAATNGGFVTIKDYIAAVHPWLMALEGDIRRAKGVFRIAGPSQNTVMFVHNSTPSPLLVDTELGRNSASLAFEWKSMSELATRIRNSSLGLPKGG